MKKLNQAQLRAAFWRAFPQFQAQHGIGSSATLPSLIRTGNPSAIRLALAIARRVNRQTEAVAA